MSSKKSRSKGDANVSIKEYFDAAQYQSIQQATQLVRKARRLAQKYRIRLLPVYQRKFCKHCYTYLTPGKNVRIRLRTNKVVYTCGKCNRQMRFVHN